MAKKKQQLDSSGKTFLSKNKNSKFLLSKFNFEMSNCKIIWNDQRVMMINIITRLRRNCCHNLEVFIFLVVYLNQLRSYHTSSFPWFQFLSLLHFVFWGIWNFFSFFPPLVCIFPMSQFFSVYYSPSLLSQLFSICLWLVLLVCFVISTSRQYLSTWSTVVSFEFFRW